MDRIFMIPNIKLTPGVHLSLPWGYIHDMTMIIVKKFIGKYMYPRSQVNVYRATVPVFYASNTIRKQKPTCFMHSSNHFVVLPISFNAL